MWSSRATLFLSDPACSPDCDMSVRHLSASCHAHCCKALDFLLHALPSACLVVKMLRHRNLCRPLPTSVDWHSSAPIWNVESMFRMQEIGVVLSKAHTSMRMYEASRVVGPSKNVDKWSTLIATAPPSSLSKYDGA